MKRSQRIQLVLIGGLSAGALTGCDSSPGRSEALRPGNVHTNNHYVANLGYYHAPFRAWYHLPYNYYDPVRNAYFHGGAWSPTPLMTITNLSAPTPEALNAAQQALGYNRYASSSGGYIYRGGFGNISSSRSVYS